MQVILKGGKLEETVVLLQGTHNHLQAQITRIEAKDQHEFKSVQKRLSDTQLNDNKISTEIEVNENNILPLTTPHHPISNKLVVDSSNSINPNDDGWNWRKYGQKKITGHLQPRSYYKCTHEGCSAKKRIEYIDSKILTTYEGGHIHNEKNSKYKKVQS